MADLYYYEEGYIDVRYHVYVADAEIALGPYIEENYIDANYYDDYSAVSSLTCELTLRPGEIVPASGTWTSAFTQSATVLRIKQSAVAITSAFSPTLTVDAFKNSFAVLDVTVALSSTAVATRSTNVLLEHIADLNAMAAKTVDILSPITATSSISATPTKSVVSSATLTSTTTLSANVDNVTFFTASISCATALTTSRFLGTGRPHPTSYINPSAYYDASDKQEGTHSIVLSGVGTIYESEPSNAFTINANENFDINFYLKLDHIPTGERTVASYGGSDYAWLIAASNVGIQSLKFYFRNAGGTVLSLNAVDIQSRIGQWMLVRAFRSGTTLGFTVNGSGVSSSFSNAFREPASFADRKISIFGVDNTTGGGTKLTKFDFLQYNIASTDIIVLPFNNNSNDFTGITQEGAVAFASTASVTAQANTSTKQAAASLASTVTATIGIDKFRSATATLSSAFTVSATIGTIEDAISLEVSAVTLTADNLRIRYFASVENSAFTPSITVIATKVGETTLSSAFTISINANSFTDVPAALSSQFNIVTNAVKSITASSALTSQATIYANGGYPIDSGSISLSSAAGFALTAIVFEGTGIAVSVTATMSVTAKRLRGIVAQPSATFTLTSEVRENPPAFQVSDYQIFPTDFSASFQWRFTSNVPNSNDELIDASFGPPNIFNSVGSGLSIAYNNGNGDDYVFVNVAYLKRVGTDQYQLYTREAQYGIAASVTNALSTFTYRSFSVNVTAINQSTGAFTITASFPMATISSTTAESVYGTYNIRILNNPEYVFAPVDINNLPSNNIQNASYSRLGQVYYLVYPQIASADLVDINFATLTAAPITVVFLTVGLIASSGTMSTAGNRIAGGNANVTSTATVNANAGLQAAATAQLTTAVTVSASASRTRNTSSDLTSAAVLTCAGSRVRFANSSIASAATQSTTAVKTATASISAESTVTQTTVGTRVRFVNTSFESIATELTVAFKNATGTVLLESAAIVSVTVRKIIDITQTLSAVFTATPNTAQGKVVGFSVTIASAFTQTVEGDRIQPAGSAMSSAFTQSTDTANSKITRVTADAGIIATTSIAVIRSRQSALAITAQFTVTANNQILKSAQAQLSSQFTPQFIITKLVRGAAALSSQGFVLTAGEVINIDPYLTITVEPETRLWQIDAESRIIVIEQETRVNIV